MVWLVAAGIAAGIVANMLALAGVVFTTGRALGRVETKVDSTHTTVQLLLKDRLK